MDKDPIEQARKMGEMLTPFLVYWAATQIAAARLGAPAMRQPTDAERRRILDESIGDAQHLAQVI